MLEIGTRLGRYEIRAKLGDGGMGEVYLTHDTKLNRKVAVRILRSDVASDRSRISRFVQEAKAASALNHPNIITIYEIDETDAAHFIAIEFIGGETLGARVKRGHLKLGEVLEVAIQATSALAAAHEAGIVHRDIKPENVMLRHDGIVKVLDFGLAKLTEPAATDFVDSEAPTTVAIKTEPGMVMGTAVYMSPEQARGLPVDARSDIFSLGVLIYEMVARRRPFEGEDRIDVLASILGDKEPPPLARYRSEAPAELDRIVQKALAKHREDRYQSAKDLLIDLRQLKKRLELDAEIERTMPPQMVEIQRSGSVSATARTVPTEEAKAKSTATSSAEYLVNQFKLHKLAAMIALAALALVIVGAGFWYFKHSP